MGTNLPKFFSVQPNKNIKKKLEDFQKLLDENHKNLIELGIEIMQFKIDLLKFDLYCTETNPNRKLSPSYLKREKKSALRQKENWEKYFSSYLQNNPAVSQKIAELTADLENILLKYETTLQTTGAQAEIKPDASKKIPISQSMKDFLVENIRTSKEDLIFLDASILEFKHRTDILAIEFVDYCEQALREIRTKIESDELLLNNGYYNNQEDFEETPSQSMKF